MSSRSTPPSIRPRACSRKISASWSKFRLDSSGSFMDGSLPDGPIEPATRRCWPVRLNSSANLRANSAARWLISKTWSCNPYSPSVSRLARKELVSITSTPTSRNERWTSSTAWGKLITSASLQPASRSPPNCAAVKFIFCKLVPIAPSKITTR